MAQSAVRDPAPVVPRSLGLREAPPFVGSQFWPAPLTPIEWFMLESEEPQYPLTFFGEFVFQGQMRRPEFELAFKATLERHPLIMSRVGRDSAGRRAWVDGRDTPPTLDWAPEGIPRTRSGDIVLERETGVRVWVRVDGQSTRLMFETHHACCDGHGAMRFVEDLLAAYAAACNGVPLELALAPVDWRMLERRGEVSSAASAQTPRGAALGVIRHALNYLGSRPRPLAARAHRLAGPEELPGMLTHILDESQSSAIRAAISRQRGTINDRALAIVLRILADWNLRHDLRADQGILRVLMPTDLRMPGDERLPAANRMTFAFISRRAVDCDDSPAFHAGLRAETSLIQRERLGVAFVHAMRALQHLPGALPLITRVTSCQATAVLSNVGDPTRRFQARFPRQAGRLVVGDLVLESITAGPPLRRGTRAAFFVSAYGGRMVLTLRCDSRLISSADAQSLMQSYVGAWQRLAADG